MLRLCTFGSVDLERPPEGDPGGVLAQPKRLALLVYLAAARPFGVHRRDELLALFWPDLDETRARDALNQALRFLRQALGPEVFVRRGGEDVGIDPARLWCDAAAFQEALEAGRPAEALELYRGDFLQGFFIEDGRGFEEWMERERTAHRESAARGARQLAETHAADGALTLAIDWGRRALELAPDDERALRRLLRWHDRAGDRAGGFRAYEAFARRFEKEFGSTPSAETRELIEKLRAGQPLTEERVAARPSPPSPRPFGQEPDAEFGNRYRIVRKLGSGGMATVYLAQDVKHDREVALKVLRPEISEGLARERFIREIRIAGRLQHPNIVPLFDSGVADERLYYVMAHIEGITLRERLIREGRFEVSVVQHILREIGGALAYAHERGVIHRDIKPENILLIDRRAVLTDFGIARAAHAARTPAGTFDQTLTQPGTSLGTPAYMAPEQAAGNPEVDQRADLYALGVVGYEMLAGRTPFVGSSPQQILMAQMLEQPAPVGELRADTPAALGALVMRCLEKKPAGRPESAKAFLADLEGRGAVVSGAPRLRGVRRTVVVAVGLLAVALFALLITWDRGNSGPSLVGRRAAVTSSDSAVPNLRLGLLPFDEIGIAPIQLDPERRLRNALSVWDSVQVQELSVALPATRAAREALGRSEARKVDADRYLLGEASRDGDSILVWLTVYSTGRNHEPRSITRRIAADAVALDSHFVRIAEDVVLSDLPAAIRSHGRGTHSLAGRRAFLRGQQAVLGWELATADSHFVAALGDDEEYAAARLWLARIRWWARRPLEQWGHEATQARARAASLDASDRTSAEALVAWAAGDVPKACARWRELTRQEPYAFEHWYSLAACLRSDNVVIPSPASPSGWRFRSSYAEALRSYQRAFHLLPAILQADRTDSYLSLRRLFFTTFQQARVGRPASPGGPRFVGLPAALGDSLAFIPWPEGRFEQATAHAAGARSAMALQREVVNEIVTTWATAYPASAAALEALSVAREMLGDPSAIEVLRKARRLAATEGERARMAAAEVWLRLKFSIPHSPKGMTAARVLADSVLQWWPSDSGLATVPLESIAALLGKTRRAVTLSARAGMDVRIPPALGRSGPALLAYAALGGPVDSIRALEQRVEEAINAYVPPGNQSAERAQWTARAASLSFPVVSSRLLDSLAGKGDPLLDAAAGWSRKDTAAVRRAILQLRQIRQGIPPEEISLDALYPESWLLMQIGDIGGAIAWLDPTLEALSRTPPRTFFDLARSASLVRALALRAELADRMEHRPDARKYAEAVSILLSDPDEPFSPLARRARQLASQK